MAFLSPAQLRNIVKEINDDWEISRRMGMQKRHDIYRDGGRRFLIEDIRREFGPKAVNEMRLAPINILKKIINKRSGIYSKPATRKTSTELDSDQTLIDFYVEEFALDETMQKANRYFNLFSNTVLYLIPKQPKIELKVIPPYLYSLVPMDFDKTQVKAFVFNAFHEEGRITFDDLPAATGVENYSRQRGFQSQPDLVETNEKQTNERDRNYIVWTDGMHVTLGESGEPLFLNPEMGEEQFLNPFGTAPVVNLAKDRDNETWATQGDDMIDLSKAIQTGWSDLLTIAKHQGFSILTVISEEEPKQLNIGINKAVWLKQREGASTPSIGYTQASSPLSEYKELLMDLLGLLLTTNDMNPSAIGGQMAEKQFNSGFQALISMSDVLMAIESDKPFLRDAEKELWQKIKAVHNFMHDVGVLSPEALSLGKFSEDFNVQIQFASVKPIESERERLEIAEKKIDMGIATKRDAVKACNPDMSDEEIEQQIKEVEEEKQANMARMQQMLGAPSSAVDEEEEEEDGQEGEV